MSSCHFHLAEMISKSTSTPAAENTSLTLAISSGPTPSPGIIVTVLRGGGSSYTTYQYHYSLQAMQKLYKLPH